MTLGSILAVIESIPIYFSLVVAILRERRRGRRRGGWGEEEEEEEKEKEYTDSFLDSVLTSVIRRTSSLTTVSLDLAPSYQA